MKVPDVQPHVTDEQGRKVYKWRIRIRSQEPTLIEFEEERFEYAAPMEEMGKLVWRTSWMPNSSFNNNGPHREVWWAMDIFDKNKGRWECIVNGKSQLKPGAAPL